MIAGGNWRRANEIVIRHLTRPTVTRYRCRDRAPRCDRRVRRLRLNDGRPMCSYCCGNFHRISYGSPAQRATARDRRIEELRKLIDDGPARLNPRPGRVLDRRLWLTFSLRRAKIVKRWEVLRDLRAGKLPQLAPTISHDAIKQ